MNDENYNEETKKVFTKTIWTSRIEDFKDKVKHLNRILERDGREPISYKFSNYRLKEVCFTHHVKGTSYAEDREEYRKVEVCDVECEGYLTVSKGNVKYNFLGSVNVSEGITQVYCRDEKYAKYFTSDFRKGWCDHCKSIRNNRKSYFLFQDPLTNEVLQIGTKCAKEYFGINSTKFLELYNSTFLVERDAEDEEGWAEECGKYVIGYDYGEVFSLLDFLTRGFTRWVKSSQCYGDSMQDNPTVEGLSTCLNERYNYGKDISKYMGSTEKLVTEEECIAYWEKKFDDEGSTFSFNCREAIRSGYATDRTLATYAYAIFGAHNAKVKENMAKEICKNLTPCKYEKGTRQTLTGRVTNVRVMEVENDYSWYGGNITKYIVDFTEDCGTLYHFTTSAAGFDKVKIGDTIKMKATIGDTRPFQNVPYTAVSRPKIMEVVSPSAA